MWRLLLRLLLQGKKACSVGAEWESAVAQCGVRCCDRRSDAWTDSMEWNGMDTWDAGDEEEEEELKERWYVTR